MRRLSFTGHNVPFKSAVPLLKPPLASLSWSVGSYLSISNERDRGKQPRHRKGPKSLPVLHSCLTIKIIGPKFCCTLRRGGLHGSTGSKGRDYCCVVRSDRNIAAIARTVRRGAASRGRISRARPQFGRPGEHCDQKLPAKSRSA
jgi:hypothetical protein